MARYFRGVHKSQWVHTWDFGRSTSEQHAAQDEADGAFVGAYVDARRLMDYSYHTRYSRVRQAVQDDIIDKVLAEGGIGCNDDDAAEREPLLLFTAGSFLHKIFDCDNIITLNVC